MTDCSCVVCQSKDIKELSNTQVAHPLWWMKGYPETTTLRYAQCLSCGYIFLSPRFSLEEYSDIYEKTPGLSRRDIQQARKPMLSARKAFIDKHTQRSDAEIVLEVGTAYGDFINLFTGAKRKIGIEPSETYVSRAKEEGSDIEYYPHMLESILANVPKLRGAAQLAMACHVLEHALDPLKFVSALAELSDDNGEVFIEVPSIEGMAEITTPLYQNLYFGHVSQFSIPVLTRIAIQCGLLPIAVEYTTTRDYPVIQGLFKKAESPASIARRFQNHALASDKILTEALSALQLVLNDDKQRSLLVWGCGQDLFDLVARFDSATKRTFRDKVTLVDRNQGKQGYEFLGIEVIAPDTIMTATFDSIIVASRSQIINQAIAADCQQHFPSTARHHIYSCGKSHG